MKENYQQLKIYKNIVQIKNGLTIQNRYGQILKQMQMVKNVGGCGYQSMLIT